MFDVGWELTGRPVELVLNDMVTSEASSYVIVFTNLWEYVNVANF
jgi:hypothetical protein